MVPTIRCSQGIRPVAARAPGTALAASVPAPDKNHLRRISRIDPGRPALAMVAPVRHQGASFAAETIRWMGSAMAMQGLSITMGERNERRGSIALVLLVAAGLIAAVAGLMLVGRNQAGFYVMFLLAALGVIGV